MTKKKHIIEAENFEQVYNFVETYPYWSISDGTDVLQTSENKEQDFAKALDKSIDIAIKRGREKLNIRVGNNEINSRFNDEMELYLDAFYNNQITSVHLQNPYRKTIVLNGRPRPEKNEMGVSAQDIQAYLNGALERQQRELELMAKNQSLEAVSQLRAEMIEREIALKREMFEKEMQNERERLQREREELAEEKERLREEYDMTNRGLAGVFKSIAGIGNEIISGNSVFNSKSKGKRGKNKTENQSTSSTNIPDEETGFEEVDTDDFEENDENDDILSGFDNLSDDDIDYLEELIKERKKQNQAHHRKSERRYTQHQNNDISKEEDFSENPDTDTELESPDNKDPT